MYDSKIFGATPFFQKINTPRLKCKISETIYVYFL